MHRRYFAPTARRWMSGPVATAAIAVAAPTAFGAGPDPAAGWHGREIRQPIAAASVPSTRQGWPRGWSAGPVRLGAGYASPKGSRRVREVQRRLRSRGYGVGPVDGRFGPRTRAALTWFQIKHRLARTGAADLATVSGLRMRPRPRPRPHGHAPVIAEPVTRTRSRA